MEEEMNIEDKVIFHEIISYFEERLKPLKEEIEGQEIEKSEEACCTIIHLLPPKEQWVLPKEQQDKNIRISSHGYSKSLRDKMEASFNNNDFMILNEKLENLSASFRN